LGVNEKIGKKIEGKSVKLKIELKFERNEE